MTLKAISLTYGYMYTLISDHFLKGHLDLLNNWGSRAIVPDRVRRNFSFHCRLFLLNADLVPRVRLQFSNNSTEQTSYLHTAVILAAH